MNTLQVPESSVSQAERGACSDAEPIIPVELLYRTIHFPEVQMQFITYSAIYALTAPQPTGEEFP